MKIAIQGHPTRGKEVIQILESLGGINTIGYKGCEKDWWYSIYPDDNCILYDNNKEDLCEFKFYTLEEFEKEFPFKIGDMVVTATERIPRQIIAFEYYNDKLCYTLEDGFHYKPQLLELYKEMKKERNITLTLDKAKEWYKKGGELKEIALQAFTEKELNPLPRSWEEFCEKYPVKETEAVICCDSSIADCKGLGEKRDSEYYRDICPSKKSAEAHLAMIQLEQLRDCWRQGWIPDYTKTYKKFRIKKLGTEYIVDWSTGLSDFLVFQTEELAKEFLKCFRDLIEKAGDLI